MEASTRIKPATGPVRDWIHAHDDRWTFWVFYIGGSVLLSVFANLFWVAMMVVFHFLLEIYRHKDCGIPSALCQGVWHLKLDVSLILFALVLSLYGDVVFAALGLGHAARATQAVRGMQMATRFAILERGIRVFLLTVDDLVRVLGVMVKYLTGRRGKTGHNGAEDNGAGKDVAGDALSAYAPVKGLGHSGDASQRSRTSLQGGDIFVLGFGGLCVALILLSPVFLDRDAAEVIGGLIHELSP